MTTTSRGAGIRPSPLNTSKSFSRFEPSTPTHYSPVRHRASTVTQGTSPSLQSPKRRLTHAELDTHGADVFEKPVAEATIQMLPEESTETLPEGFDELPIELMSLADRFIASLTTAKVYATPPSIDRLSEIFQDFYAQAENHISTHIQALSSRMQRDSSPAPSISSKASGNSRTSSRPRGAEQQMLTPNEVYDRRRARRLLENKRVALEEAMERRVCEGIYDRIWRHRGTLDEIRDEKLRSKTAALALVGIGLKDLGIDLDSTLSETELQARAKHIDEWVLEARTGLMEMNNAKYPLGKLQHLTKAHQSIVDLLTDVHQSSSSADEILPTLIYTLITSPPEGMNMISNLNFIQRFRSNTKIDGEAAYCLTNLEAAITFLETVDLASLRENENQTSKNYAHSRPATPRTESRPNMPSAIPSKAVATLASVTTTSMPLAFNNSAAYSHPLSSSPGTDTSVPPSPAQQRRLSTLFQPPASAIGAATDAVRNTADQGFKSIGSTLDHSFKFLFGKLKEQQVHGPGVDGEGAVIVPRTLDDARKLVSPKVGPDEDGNFSASSSVSGHPDEAIDSTPRADDRLMDLLGGKKAARDRSVDSIVSNSSRRVAFASDPSMPREKAANFSNPLNSGPPTPTTLGSNQAVESMRNLGNTLNPLNRFAGINVMRGFGRSMSTTPPPAASAIAEPPSSLPPLQEKLQVKMVPPIAKFLDIADASEMKIGEVAILLKDYKRLAENCKIAGMY
ncbi:hypothetical protein MMC25_000323 [Agyrium rufum]|nr:hypothetical protein [Agyrium rufum]